MNLKHEYNKVVEAYNNKTITEDKLKYELYKLECVAKTLNKKWDPPTKSNIRPDHSIRLFLSEAVEEDCKELNKLYESGILNESRYNRDCKKIMAMCSIAGIEYPGDNSPGIDMIVESMDEYDDGDEYADMDEDDEFEEDDEEEASEPQMESYLTLSDGSILSRWVVDSEYTWQNDIVDCGNDCSSIEYDPNNQLNAFELEMILYKNINDFGGVENVIKLADEAIENKRKYAIPDHDDDPTTPQALWDRGWNQHIVSAVRALNGTKKALMSGKYPKYLKRRWESTRAIDDFDTDDVTFGLFHILQTFIEGNLKYVA